MISRSLTKKFKENIFDISNLNKIKKVILDFEPEYIFHLAAQSIVKKSYTDPILTWRSNLIGTLNILESVRFLKKKCNLIIITSDKCYKNFERNSGYKESDILGGDDNYSASKASIEILVNSYFNSYFVNSSKIKIATARAGNVIGGGDFSKDRIVPDAAKSFHKLKLLTIRHPKSTRPWQHVLEPLFGYLILGKKLSKNKYLSGNAFNFGPDNKKNYSVIDVVKKLNFYWVNLNWIIKKDKNKIKETKILRLNSQKAFKILKWKTMLSFQETIEYTALWYKNFYLLPNKIINLYYSQIDEYMRKIKY
jgi:CDP-glucose 4,6-dehydratase